VAIAPGASGMAARHDHHPCCPLAQNRLLPRRSVTVHIRTEDRTPALRIVEGFRRSEPFRPSPGSRHEWGLPDDAPLLRVAEPRNRSSDASFVQADPDVDQPEAVPAVSVPIIPSSRLGGVGRCANPSCALPSAYRCPTHPATIGCGFPISDSTTRRRIRVPESSPVPIGRRSRCQRRCRDTRSRRDPPRSHWARTR